MKAKAKAKAPANIAFIKYWGKKNERLRLPANTSISMNLSGVLTITSVEFDEELRGDVVNIDGAPVVGSEKERVSAHLDLVRKLAKVKWQARVVSHSNFPKGTGLASSASAFAALTLSAARALNLNLAEKELSILARFGSGSACRSIPDGFVEWKTGKSSDDSYAYSLYPPRYWDVCDVVAIVGESAKKVGSSQGHALARSSPFYTARIKGIPAKIRAIKLAMKRRDLTAFGEIVEAEALNMHAVMMTSRPPLLYVGGETLTLISAVTEARKNGLEVYFTLDAGPNVHLICRKTDAGKVKALLSSFGFVKKVIVNLPAAGARVIE